jgi:hypothetical protein
MTLHTHTYIYINAYNVRKLVGDATTNGNRRPTETQKQKLVDFSELLHNNLVILWLVDIL